MRRRNRRTSFSASNVSFISEAERGLVTVYISRIIVGNNSFRFDGGCVSTVSAVTRSAFLNLIMNLRSILKHHSVCEGATLTARL